MSNYEPSTYGDRIADVYDVSTQHVVLREDGIRLQPVQIRYAWRAELDLMAQLAGLRLRERWGGWRREPFVAASTQHVAVYGLA